MAAEGFLAKSQAIAQRVRDRRQIAALKRVSARLYILRDDLPAARVALTEASDLFKRLGMRRELAEAQQALADL